MRATFTPVEFRMDAVKGLVADVLVTAVATGNGEPPERETELVEDVAVQINTTEGLGAGGPATAGTAVADCDILNLVLGPLDLNILGLQIDLSQVVLDIVAQPGAGNLLGNLLRAVAGLLDSGSPLGNLLGQVNDLLSDLLGGLLGGLSA